MCGYEGAPNNWNDQLNPAEIVQEPTWEETDVLIQAISGQHDETDLPFYKAVAHHENASPDNIRLAAESLLQLETEHTSGGAKAINSAP